MFLTETGIMQLSTRDSSSNGATPNNAEIQSFYFTIEEGEVT